MEKKQPRTVRMSDQQWRKVKTLAAIKGIPIGKLIYKLVIRDLRKYEVV